MGQLRGGRRRATLAGATVHDRGGFRVLGPPKPTAIMSGAGWISRAGGPRPAASFAGAWPGGGLALLLVALAVQQGDQAEDLLHVLVGPVE